MSMFQVDELIKALADLGCARTTGEDQTICVVSDSFNNNGGAAGLQARGDLPPVDVVKVMVKLSTVCWPNRHSHDTCMCVI